VIFCLPDDNRAVTIPRSAARCCRPPRC